MKTYKFEEIVDSDNDCIELGLELSKYLQQGDVLLLNGDLASGKTTFSKGILKGLDYRMEVTSPTFTLVNEYDAKFKVIHIDFYRETNVERWINLGIHEYFDTKNIVIIEWPNLVPQLLPDNAINIYFNHLDNNKRHIILK